MSAKQVAAELALRATQLSNLEACTHVVLVLPSATAVSCAVPVQRRVQCLGASQVQLGGGVVGGTEGDDSGDCEMPNSERGGGEAGGR